MRERTKHTGIIKLSDGKYEVRVPKGYDPIRNRYPQHQEIFYGKLGEARARQGDIERALKHEPLNKSIMTMSQLMTKYFNHKIGKGDSYDAIKTDMGRWRIMEPRLGHLNITAVTVMDVDDILNALQTTRGIKGQTINNYRSVLSGAFTQANHWRLMVGSPVKGVVSRQRSPYRKKLPTFDQIDFLIRAYETRINYQMGPFLQLTWLNSMRRAETCGLRVENFIPEEQTLVVDKVVYLKRLEDGGGWFLKPLKNNVIKEIKPLDKFTFDLLTELAAKRNHPSDFLFSDDGGETPWPPQRVTQSQRRIRELLCPKCGYVGKREGKCPKCGIEVGLYFRVHDLRGWMTTYLIRKGFSKAAQERGGWKDENVMRKYYNSLTSDEAGDAAAGIDELIGTGK